MVEISAVMVASTRWRLVMMLWVASTRARILGAEAREFTKKQRFNQQKTRHLRPKT